MLENVLKKYQGFEVSAMDVYSDMFQLGSNAIQRNLEEKGQYKSNPLGYFKNEKENKGHYRIMFEDTFEKNLKVLQQADFSIMNGITYFGRKNVQEHASKMFGMIFDLDGVTDQTLDNFLYASFNKDARIYPIPNYIILSGHGVHLYYVFERPIPLYPNIKLQLKEFKYELTRKVWNRYTTKSFEKVQYQGINQGFRVIGGKTKIKGIKVRAFQMNTHPYCLEELNEYVPEEHQIDEKKLWKESTLTIAQAKKQYPIWYEKRVVKGEPRGTWICKEDLYQWWLKKITKEVNVGHRYFCVMCLAIYGIKSGVSKEQVKKDAIELIPIFNEMSSDDPFTTNDIYSALECYDERYMTFPINDISKISGIVIEKNKRNGRKQDVHLKIARSTRDIIHNNWREGNGRPIGSGTKEKIINDYLKVHPTETPTQIARALNVSRPTVYKYLEKSEK
jgi:hypothetical protein